MCPLTKVEGRLQLKMMQSSGWNQQRLWQSQNEVNSVFCDSCVIVKTSVLCQFRVTFLSS